jgi:hypothetical protein
MTPTTRARQLPEAELEALAGRQRADFFLAAAELADRSIVGRRAFRGHVRRFGEAREALAREAVLNHQFGPVADNPAEFDSLLALAHRKQELWRGAALHLFARGADLGFDAAERIVVARGLQIASIMDEVYLAWRAALVTSDLGRRLKAMGAEKAAAWLTERGATNPYAIVVADGAGSVRQVAYAEAFATQYARLDRVLARLLAELRALPEAAPAAAFRGYFEAYRRALGERDLSKLEDVWRAVDEAWMEIRGPVQPVHAMESYMEPARLRVDPEFRVVIADARARSVNERALVTQARLIRDLGEMFREYETFRFSRPAMESSLVFAGTTIAMSGCSLDFRLAGQIVPNRSEIRVRRGVKIFLDLKSMAIRAALMREKMARVFGWEVAERELVDPDFLISAGILVSGHEVAHNAFVTTETDARIGKTVRALLEETKADFCGVAPLLRQVARGELGNAELRRVLAWLVATSLRDLLSREQESHRPYYLKSVAYLNLMHQSGLLRQDGARWALDFAEPRVAGFFGRLEASFLRLADVYERYDRAAAKSWLNEYFVETPPILDLVERVRGTD